MYEPTFEESHYVRQLFHELRASIGAIETAIKLILEGFAGEVPEKAREMLQIIELRTDELLQLLDDVLILSRSRGGKFREEKEIVSLAETVKKVAALLRPQTKEKKIVLEINLDSDLPPLVGDQEILEDLFSNLLGNAIKYTPTGGKITVEAENQADSVLLRISDTGIGIAADELPKIFYEFYRAKNAREFVKVGTGLGLSIVKAIVDAYGGSISVTSELNQGTIFEVSIPLLNKVDQGK